MNIQCESCHWHEQNHLSEMKSMPVADPPTETECRRESAMRPILWMNDSGIELQKWIRQYSKMILK